MTDYWILRDIDNRDGDEPYETVPLALPMHAGYIDGPLLADLTNPNEHADDIRRIAAEMREGRLSDGDQTILREMSIYMRKAEKP